MIPNDGYHLKAKICIRHWFLNLESTKISSPKRTKIFKNTFKGTIENRDCHPFMLLKKRSKQGFSDKIDTFEAWKRWKTPIYSVKTFLIIRIQWWSIETLSFRDFLCLNAWKCLFCPESTVCCVIFRSVNEWQSRFQIVSLSAFLKIFVCLGGGRIP